MKTITVKRKDGKEYKKYLFNIKEENCPLCDEPLKNSGTAWNIFHGEVNRFCCNSSWQTKNFSPPAGEEENYKEFFKELNKPEFNQIKYGEELWKPLREAFEKVGVKDCKNEEVYKYIKEKYPELLS